MVETFYPAGEVNVGEKERAASILGGFGLMMVAMLRPSRASLVLAT